jgi:type II secretory pathway pseudopilin PulG
MLGAIFLSFFGLFFGLIGANFTGAQSKARDTERKTDINALHAKLEEYYNENSSYPLPQDLNERGSTLLPGINGEAFIDPNNNRINEGDYKYETQQCSVIGCARYKLSTKMENGEDYYKLSLN